MKSKIKQLLGWLKCKIYRICKSGKKVYIGNRTKIIGGKYITLGNDVQIRPDGCINCNKDAILKIEDNVDIGCRSRISSGKKIIIEKDVLTGPNVFISDQDHRYDQVGIPIKEQGVVIKEGNGICIKEGAWIGTNSVIIGNVEIGKGSVIGANTAVTKNIPDYCVAAGVPAKIIKIYNQDIKRWERYHEN